MKSPYLWLLLFLLGITAGAWYVREALHQPAGTGLHVLIEVAPRSRLLGVLEDLAHKGVLKHPYVLYVYARIKGKTEIKVGEYEFSALARPLAILRALNEGRIKLETLTIAEGLNRFEIRELLAKQKWIEPHKFEALCDNAEFLQEHAIPGPTCEGYLFPDTYKFARGKNAESILAAMFMRYTKALAEVLEEVAQEAGGRGHNLGAATGFGPLKFNERELLTFASLIEKETGQVVERSHISCVFYNRLRARPAWRLETDPTVIYGLRRVHSNFDGNLKKMHLRSFKSPYNTYRVYGLPPGPIANPGKAALKAALLPSKCKDFFFVSRNDGSHVFCPNIRCHNQAVQKWQIDFFNKTEVLTATSVEAEEPVEKSPKASLKKVKVEVVTKKRLTPKKAPKSTLLPLKTKLKTPKIKALPKNYSHHR